MKRRLVFYAPEAGNDLDWIYETVADASSPVTADRYDRRIRAFCERLDHGSERGTRRDEIKEGLRVVGFERSVTVAFMVEFDRVVILRIFYGGADWQEELARSGED
ncbi:type II toxin-antitoxin system RelE/ParE family toxin [Rhizobiaceae sp. 2RAB30]